MARDNVSLSAALLAGEPRREAARGTGLQVSMVRRSRHLRYPERAKVANARRSPSGSALFLSDGALADYLGHSDPGFTLRIYTHLMPSSEARARRAVDDALGASRVSAVSRGAPEGTLAQVSHLRV